MNIIAGVGPCVYINEFAGYGGSGDLDYYEQEYYNEVSGEYYYWEDFDVVGGDEVALNKFGIGANAIVGIEAKGWQIGLVYDYSFTKMFQDLTYNAHHKSVKLSFTYFFDPELLY